MTQDELDELPFGVLKLDGQGRIIGYNRLEEQIAGVDYSTYLSHNFFTEIAPCMDNPFFAGVSRTASRKATSRWTSSTRATSTRAPNTSGFGC
jgi:photoactive yellow protein